MVVAGADGEVVVEGARTLRRNLAPVRSSDHGLTLTTPAERVEVMRGAHGDSKSLFGPLPGFRAGDVVA